MGKASGSTYYIIDKYRIYKVILLEKEKIIIDNGKTCELKSRWLVKKQDNEKIYIYSEFLYKKLDRAKRIRKKMIINKIKSKIKITCRRYSLIINFLKRLYFKSINIFCNLQYVVLDCEFNRGNEIIQLSLIKLTPNMEKIDSLDLFIKPKNYNVINTKKEYRKDILQKSNESEITFPIGINIINNWLGNNYKTILCSWSYSDIATIENNILMHNLPKKALKYNYYLDIQNFFTEIKDNNYYYPDLKSVLDKEQIPISEPLHNALNDAKYTANILENVYNRQPLLIAEYLA
jgi:inhibitor of KinA sporulation pathway (predicted exonuclease)